METTNVNPGISIVDGNLLVNGRITLTGVPGNIILTPATRLGLPTAAFLGVRASESRSHHVFPIGILEGLRFMCCFRFKLWWMTQRMGTCGKDVPLETQFMLLEGKEMSYLSEEMDSDKGDQIIYTVLLPLLDGSFRSSLQGNEKNELELCLESGDPAVQTSENQHSLLINSGTDPFNVLTEAVKAVEEDLQTFHHREKKRMPNFVNWFGWCTWDAFYTDVTAEGVHQGLQSLSSGGTPPRFLIIDDGWQSVASEQQSTMTTTIAAGTQYPSRLIDIKENHKFQKTAKAVEKQDELSMGLKHLVQDAKSKHKLKYIYVWHALTGYWGGVKPGVAGMEHYETEMAYPVISPGVLNNEPTLGSDCLTIYGLGLVNPKKIFHFYDDLHSYLAKSGIDGVKVDVQNIIETLGVGFGGRVSITRQYHQALEASVSRNFPDNGCIACMCHNTDMLYSAKQTAVVRASDDFWPRDPASHTIHIASVAYNSLFLGEFMQPDWDMFHSLHPAAEYHAAARALGGCPVYVSDKPGNHDFSLLKKLVLPDGSILRARLPGRPTLDCLFVDPARDNKSLLKIWNINNYTGVLGAFNCQGAGWCHIDKRNKILDATPMTITGSVHARDVDSLADAADGDWNGDCAMYSHRAGDLIYLPKNTALPVTLKVLEYEVFTVAPVKNLGSSIACAPLGLLDMFNAGGAIEYLEYERPQKSRDSGFFDGVIEEQTSYCLGKDRQPLAVVKMKVRGCGRFGMYSTQKPKRCSVENSSIDFSYNPMSGLVTLVLPLPQNELHQWDVKVEV